MARKQKELPEKSEDQKAKDDWMQNKWRPAMGWMYMMVCVFDFMVFPILWAIVQFWETDAANDAFRQWQPLTLQGAGLFHMAMGAVLGISAYGRTQEKLSGSASNGMQMPDAQPASPSAFGSSPMPTRREPTLDSVSSGFGSVGTGFGGKKAPPVAFQPEL